MNEFVFETTPRVEVGRNSGKQLRADHKIPAIIYGSKKEPMSVTLDHNHFINTIKDENVFTSVVTVKIDGKDNMAVIKEIQRHPYANKILHVDFLRIDDKTEITKTVPLKTVDVDRSPGVKLGALLTLLQASVEIRCLPKDLPSHIDIDCSKMEASTTLKISKLVIPKGVKIVALLRGKKDNDHAVVMVGKTR